MVESVPVSGFPYWCQERHLAIQIFLPTLTAGVLPLFVCVSLFFRTISQQVRPSSGTAVYPHMPILCVASVPNESAST